MTQDNTGDREHESALNSILTKNAVINYQGSVVHTTEQYGIVCRCNLGVWQKLYLTESKHQSKGYNFEVTKYLYILVYQFVL